MGSIFLLVQYTAIVIWIYCQSSWKHSGQSSWKHSGQSSWKHSGLSSLKRLEISSLQQNYYHTKRKLPKSDLGEVDREECNCIRLARQFGHHMKDYRYRFFTYVLFQTPTLCVVQNVG